MLVGSSLSLRFGSTVALAEVSATVDAGEVVALVGASGSGKTSLLYVLSGLLKPTAGLVTFEGEDVTALGVEAQAALRRRAFGFVFQFAELVPELTLRENISLPLELNDVRAAERRERVSEILGVLGIAQQADRRPAQVSGGQAQRAAVARALVHRPGVLFADEPTGSLDRDNGLRVLQTILSVAQDFGTAVVLVTHDDGVASSAHRVLRMADGHVIGQPDA